MWRRVALLLLLSIPPLVGAVVGSHIHSRSAEPVPELPKPPAWDSATTLQNRAEALSKWSRESDRVLRARFESSEQALLFITRGLLAGALLGIAIAVALFLWLRYLAEAEAALLNLQRDTSHEPALIHGWVPGATNLFVRPSPTEPDAAPHDPSHGAALPAGPAERSSGVGGSLIKITTVVVMGFLIALMRLVLHSPGDIAGEAQVSPPSRVVENSSKEMTTPAQKTKDELRARKSSIASTENHGLDAASGLAILPQAPQRANDVGDGWTTQALPEFKVTFKVPGGKEVVTRHSIDSPMGTTPFEMHSWDDSEGAVFRYAVVRMQVPIDLRDPERVVEALDTFTRSRVISTIAPTYQRTVVGYDELRALEIEHTLSGLSNEDPSKGNQRAGFQALLFANAVLNLEVIYDSSNPSATNAARTFLRSIRVKGQAGEILDTQERTLNHNAKVETISGVPGALPLGWRYETPKESAFGIAFPAKPTSQQTSQRTMLGVLFTCTLLGLKTDQEEMVFRVMRFPEPRELPDHTADIIADSILQSYANITQPRTRSETPIQVDGVRGRQGEFEIAPGTAFPEGARCLMRVLADSSGIYIASYVGKMHVPPTNGRVFIASMRRPR